MLPRGHLYTSSRPSKAASEPGVDRMASYLHRFRFEQDRSLSPTSTTRHRTTQLTSPRSEIETPSPARVKDLQHKLWDQNERLLAGEPRFRSRYYKAALADRELMTPAAEPNSSHQPSRNSHSRSRLEARMERMTQQPASSQMERISQRSSTASSPSRSAERSLERSTQRSAHRRVDARQRTTTVEEPMRTEAPRSSTATAKVEPSQHSVRPQPKKAPLTDPPTLDTLVARLAAVKRDDPNEALKEIDAILQQADLKPTEDLRQAGVSKYLMEAASKPTDEDDDSTSVSSITNPTYLGGESRARRHKHHWSERKKEQIHPPDHIRLKPTKEEEEEPVREEVVEPPVPQPKETVVSARDRIMGAVDRMLNHDDDDEIPSSESAELAQKLRKWEEMSAVKQTGSSDGDVTPVPSVPPMPDPSKRVHPWDASMPVKTGKINMRDTSMDVGEGVEAEFAPRYDESRAAGLVTPTRRMRAERLREQARALRAAKAEEPAVEPRRDSFDDGFAQEPASNLGTPERMNKHMDMADDFDSAWVALPQNAFFSEKPRGSRPNEPLSPVSQPETSAVKPNEHTRELSTPTNEEPMSQRDERLLLSNTTSSDASEYETEKTSEDSYRETKRYAPPNGYRKRVDDFQVFEPDTRDRRHDSRREFRGVSPMRNLPASEMRSAYDNGRVGDTVEDSIEVALVTEPKKRGLRALLSRRSGSKLDGNSSLASGSTGGRLKNQHLLQVNNSLEIEPPVRSRGRRSSKSPSRLRARSLEERRIRNPGIARKFGRLLRVYDDDDGPAHF